MHNLINNYSTNPWKNLDVGFGKDGKLAAIGTSLAIILTTIAVIGAVCGLTVTIILLYTVSKRREELKEQFVTRCIIIIAICFAPGILSIGGMIAHALLGM